MRENLFGCLTLSRHALGAALAHSHTVAPASAGQEGPLIVQFHDLIHLGFVVIVFVVGQMLEGMLFTPLLVGDRIGLHPVAVIFAVMAGGQLFGFVGILLALPVAAVIAVVLRTVHESYVASELYSSGND